MIYALLWLVSVVRVGRSTAVALLRSEAAGEKPPRANWFLSLLGLILLGAAYYLAVSIKNPLDAITWFFVAVVLVIFATYLLMITTSVLLCRVLQKNQTVLLPRKPLCLRLLDGLSHEAATARGWRPSAFWQRWCSS